MSKGVILVQSEKSSILEIPIPLMPGLAPGTKAYQMGECFILVSHEPQGWHLSISCRHRYPLWDEIRDARYELLPNNLTMAMLLPPKKQYVNVHPNCFHLYQINDPEVNVRP